MTGRYVVFTTQLTKVAIGGKFYRVWCLVHQLDLIIKAWLHVIAFIGVATTIIGWLRLQDTLIRNIG